MSSLDDVATKDLILFIHTIKKKLKAIPERVRRFQIEKDKRLLVLLGRLRKKNCFEAIEFVLNHPHYVVTCVSYPSTDLLCSVTKQPIVVEAVSLDFGNHRIIIDLKNKPFLEAFRDFAYFGDVVSRVFASSSCSTYEVYKKYYVLNTFINDLLLLG